MTRDEAHRLLCERIALERIAMALEQPGTPAPEWRFLLPLIERRVHEIAGCLGQEDPSLVAAAEHLRAADILSPPEPEPSQAETVPELPAGARIH